MKKDKSGSSYIQVLGATERGERKWRQGIIKEMIEIKFPYLKQATCLQRSFSECIS